MIDRLRKRKKDFLLLLIFISAGIIAYFPAFQAPFQLDDVAVIVENPTVRNITPIIQIFRYDPTRFIAHLSFAINCRLDGLNVFYFHLVNFILHLICSGLVFYLVKMTLALPARDGERIRVSDNFWISFFASLIFLAHPLQTQAVTYIVQRSTLLAALHVFLALLLYIRLKSRFCRRDYALTWLIVISGSMTKPIFIVLPGLILAYEICFFEGSWKVFRKNLFQFLPYFFPVLAIPVFLLLFSLKYNSEAFDFSKIEYMTRLTSEISRWQYLLTQSRVILTYVRLLFLPVGQNVDYDYPLSYGLFEIGTLCSVLFLLAVLALAFWLIKRNAIMALAILWFFIALIPESSIFPIPDVIFEHRLYLAMAGFALWLCYGLSLMVQNRVRYIIYLALITVSFMLLAFARNMVWADRITLFEDVVSKSPHKSRPHNVLGAIYEESGFLKDAEKEYKKAIFLDEKSFGPHYNLGQLYAMMGRNAEAITQYKKALGRNPQNYRANLNLGKLYHEIGKWEWAASQYHKAMSIRPQEDEPYLYLGDIYSKLWNFGDAQRFYKEAISRNPNRARSYNALGKLCFSQRLYRQAVPLFLKVVSLNPRLAEAYYFLGIAYREIGDLSRAEYYLKKAIALKPGERPAYEDLIELYRKSGKPGQAEDFLNIVPPLKQKEK